MIWFPSRFGLPSNEGGTLGQLAKCRDLSVEQWNAAEDSPSASVTTSLPSDHPPPPPASGPSVQPHVDCNGVHTHSGCRGSPGRFLGPWGLSELVRTCRGFSSTQCLHLPEQRWDPARVQISVTSHLPFCAENFGQQLPQFPKHQVIPCIYNGKVIQNGGCL